MLHPFAQTQLAKYSIEIIDLYIKPGARVCVSATNSQMIIKGFIKGLIATFKSGVGITSKLLN